jgi:hypothetical protein
MMIKLNCGGALPPKRRQAGSVGVEYMIVTLVAAIILFGSYEGGDSIAVMLAKAVAGYIATLTYVISLP